MPAAQQLEMEPERQEAIGLLVRRNEINRPEIAILWDTFLNQITRIPRDGKSEGLMARQIVEWSNEMDGATAETDGMNNVLIRLPATRGYEGASGIIFQGHSDMVCVKETDARKDPARDGVTPIVSADGQWIHAVGTTLGGDNGNALAIMRTLGHSKKPHGPIAFLVTTQEEIGLFGAKATEFDLNSYKYLINLDSEEENVATIGSAGGGNTELIVPITYKTLHDVELVSLKVGGLLGGHSALYIDQNRGNAIKVLASVIKTVGDNCPFDIVMFEGGNKMNAIPTDARAIVAVHQNNMEYFLNYIEHARETLTNMLPDEPKLSISVPEQLHQNEVKALTETSAQNVINLLLDLPHGVEAMSKDVQGLVETSTNLAVVIQEPNNIHIRHMTRSSVENDLETLRVKIAKKGEASGADVIQEETYAGWEPDPESPIISFVRKAYEVRGHRLAVTATHGGLEIGTLLKNYTHLLGISLGPTILDPHTTPEGLNVPSTEEMYYISEEIIAQALLEMPRSSDIYQASDIDSESGYYPLLDDID